MPLCDKVAPECVNVRPLFRVNDFALSTVSVPETVKSVFCKVEVPEMDKLLSVLPPPSMVLEVPVIARVEPVTVGVPLPAKSKLPETVWVAAANVTVPLELIWKLSRVWEAEVKVPVPSITSVLPLVAV